MQGILIVDKPAGWTSFDVVAKMRGVLGTRKLGHSGTLDPMATGVLPVFCGGASKAVDLQLDHDKTYRAVLRLGSRCIVHSIRRGFPIAQRPQMPHRESGRFLGGGLGGRFGGLLNHRGRFRRCRSRRGAGGQAKGQQQGRYPLCFHPGAPFRTGFWPLHSPPASVRRCRSGSPARRPGRG